MNEIVRNSLAFILGTVMFITLIFLPVDIHMVAKTRRDKQVPYYKLTLMRYVLNIQLKILIFLACILFIYIFFTEDLKMDFWLNLLVNVISSLILTAILTIVFYFRVLRHIPEETKKQIDEMLNNRLNHETANHNAVIQTNIQTSHDVRESLSKEHLEIKQNLSATRDEIKDANSEIKLVSQKIDSEKESRAERYNCLSNSDKEIANSITKISVLGEVLKEVNYKNKDLSSEVERLTAENKKLVEEVSQLKSRLPHQQQEYHEDIDFTQKM